MDISFNFPFGCAVLSSFINNELFLDINVVFLELYIFGSAFIIEYLNFLFFGFFKRTTFLSISNSNKLFTIDRSYNVSVKKEDIDIQL